MPTAPTYAEPQAAVSPDPPEVIVAREHRVACDGGGGALGHPRVWLEMGAAGFVECGYCDRRFVLGDHAHDEDVENDPGDWQGSAGT